MTRRPCLRPKSPGRILAFCGRTRLAPVYVPIETSDWSIRISPKV